MNYTLNRKKNNKKAYIRVINGEVIVNAPYFMSNREIDQFVNTNKEWIVSQLTKDRIVQDNDMIYLLGTQYIVQIHNELCCYVKDEYIYLYRNKKMIDSFLYKNIQHYMESRFLYFCRQLDIHDVSLKFGVYKSKWGSCTPKKKLICFNVNLIFMPLDFIDAIILHELAHLYYLNHSKDFYNLLLRWMPQYKEVIKKGKEYHVPRLY